MDPINNDKIVYIESNCFKRKDNENKENQPDEKKQKSDNLQVIYNNQIYWWKEDNKNSKRFVCIRRDKDLCPASITIKDNKVIRASPHLNHLPMSDDDIILFSAEKSLKKEVTCKLKVFIENV